MSGLMEHKDGPTTIGAQAEEAAPMPVPYGLYWHVAEESAGAADVVRSEWMASTPGWWARLCDMAMEDGETGNTASAYRMALIVVERCPEGAASRLVVSEGFRYCLEECLDTARSEAEDAASALADGDPFFGTRPTDLTEIERVRLARLSLLRAVSLLMLLAKAFGGSVVEDAKAMERALDGLVEDDGTALAGVAKDASELCGHLGSLAEIAMNAFEEEVGQSAALIEALSDPEVLEEANRLIATRYGIGVEVPMLMEECCELGKAASKYLRSTRGFGVPRANEEVRDSLADEISDVYMMCEQVRILAGIGTGEIRAGVIRKVARTMRRAEMPMEQAIRGCRIHNGRGGETE